MKRPRPTLTTFIALTGLTQLVYLIVFTLPFPLTRLFATIPPVDYAKLTGYSIVGVVAFVLGLLILFGIYIWLLKWPSTPTLPDTAPYTGLLFALTLMLSYPVLAIDLFIYAIRTRGWGLYGFNPLATPPDILPATDPWLGLAAEWRDAPSPYGVLWEAMSLGAFRLTGGDFLAHLFALKGIAIISYVGCIFLIGAILGKLQPKWRVVGMFAFAWNPLVLLEAAQNGHNDIVMVFFLLAALWALTTGKETWAIPLLALSVLVKFVTILIAPLLILHLAMKRTTWPQRLLTAIRHSLVLAMLVIGPTLPLWPGIENWAVLKASSSAGRSFMALSIFALRPMVGVNKAFDMSRLGINGLSIGICLWLLWRKRKAFAQLTTPIFVGWGVFFWYVLLAAPLFHAWYILWFLPLAIVLLPNQHPLQASVLFSATGLLITPYFEIVRIWWPILLHNPLWGHLIGVSLLLAPPAIAALYRS
jgi:hypothetical protein